MLKLLQVAAIQPFAGLLALLRTAIILPFDSLAITQGCILRDTTTGLAVSIESGDNGVDAALVLTPGVVAFLAPMNHNIIAILADFFFARAAHIVRTISHTEQLNVLLMPTSASVCHWFWQLRESPQREALARDIRRA